MDTKDILNAKRLIVHAGGFHSDDLMCAAMMKLVNPDITIERVTAVPEDIGKDTVVCDIGKGEFDHHQKDARVDENGHKYCAAELLYEKIKDALPIDDRENFEKILFCIGQNDNGEKRDTLSAVFSLYNTEWDREDNADRRFRRLTDLIVQRLTEEKDLSLTEIVPDHELENGFEDYLTGTTAMFLSNDTFSGKFIHSAELEYADHVRALRHAEKIMEDALLKSDGHIVNLDAFAPYESLIPTTAEFVIFESDRGGFNLIAIPPEPGSFEQKIPIPNAVENMPGCTFCHPAHFIAVFETEKQANAAAETIIKEHYKDVSKEQPEAGGDEQEI